MKSRTGRTTAAMRSLVAIQMPSGMPSTRLITADAVISASVLIVAGQNPVAMMTKNEAAQKSPNFQLTRHRPMAEMAPATAQSGNATRAASIAAVKPAITLPRFYSVPLSWASTKFSSWLTHWPIGKASCIAGLLTAQVLEQNRLSHGPHVNPVAVDHRERVWISRNLSQHVAKRAGAGERGHMIQQGPGQIGPALAQAAQQRIDRYDADQVVRRIQQKAVVALDRAQVLDGRPEFVRDVARHRENGHLVGAGDIADRQVARQVDPSEKRPHVVGGRIARDLVRIPDLHHGAALHDGDAVADTECLVQVV